MNRVIGYEDSVRRNLLVREALACGVFKLRDTGPEKLFRSERHRGIDEIAKGCREGEVGASLGSSKDIEGAEEGNC